LTAAERRSWPSADGWVDVAWVAFAAANLVAMVVFASWETVPFHFIWVSLTLLYGFRVWPAKPTAITLACVIVGTGTLILVDVSHGLQPIDEITEVPLMAAMFLAMVWHARRHLAVTEEVERVSEANLQLLERERRFVQDASHELRTPPRCRRPRSRRGCCSVPPVRCAC
jgi:two-component system OmpR family sensor kinase